MELHLAQETKICFMRLKKGQWPCRCLCCDKTHVFPGPIDEDTNNNKIRPSPSILYNQRRCENMAHPQSLSCQGLEAPDPLPVGDQRLLAIRESAVAVPMAPIVAFYFLV